MTRARTALLSLLLAIGAAPQASRAADLATEAVSFQVSNPLVPGSTYTVRGRMIRPAGCLGTAVLAVHGLSYGAWAWDFPLKPETYSTARALAARGFAVVAIDKLGYGSSDKPNGYTLTVESYAAMTAQISAQLRDGSFEGSDASGFARVGLLGHSAGAEIVELTAGLYPESADFVIPTGYQHALDGVSQEWLAREWIPGDVVRSLQSDYEYFESDPQTRAADMYNLAVADPAIVARDNEMANLTPSGEILSISTQPSRYVMGSIEAPVLLVLAENDALFPSSNAQNELALFTAATDRALHVVPAAGHVLTLHPNAPATSHVMGDWLEARPFPRCS